MDTWTCELYLISKPKPEVSGCPLVWQAQQEHLGHTGQMHVYGWLVTFWSLGQVSDSKLLSEPSHSLPYFSALFPKLLSMIGP